MGEVRPGRKEQTRQSRQRREDVRQGEGRKRQSTPQTKLKSRGGNPGDLKTTIYK